MSEGLMEATTADPPAPIEAVTAGSTAEVASAEKASAERAAALACECPPPAARPPEPAADDPRAELLRMAQSLMRVRDGRLLVEYLRLRRALH